ncbi:MAG: protein kinase, partial [Pseudonocardia sp.]|nr:protein kinase [Pseudonocardia sp.]
MADEMFGPYRLEQLLRRSETGELWQATDTARGRSVALKLLPPGLASDPEFQARFRRECALAAQLDEPHIIPIHGFGEIDGRPFVDMRFVRGVDLARLIAGRGPLPPADTVIMTAQVAAALDAAHAAGLVHGDIRPVNVLVVTGSEEHGELVCNSDFSGARPLNACTARPMAGAMVGSVEYTAPERLLHGRADHRVDVYALGCLLYEAMTARKPFPGEGLPAMIQAHLNEAPPRPSHYAPGVSEALDRVVATAMAKDPDHRYGSAGALAAAARDALGPIAVKSEARRSGKTGERGDRCENTVDFATVPGLRVNCAPTPPQDLPSADPSNRMRQPGRSALAGAVALLLAAGIGVLALDQERSGSGPQALDTTTAATARPTKAPAGPVATAVGQAERTLVGHAGTVCAVATAQLDGRPVVVSGSWDKTVRAWDLASGAPIGSPFAGHTDLVLAVATTQLNGRPVVVSGGKDNTVRVSDLATGTPIGSTLTGHTDT